MTKIKWKAHFHLKYVDKEFLAIAKKAGCGEIEFSPDGFSQETLETLKKEITVNDIVKSYDLCAKLNMKICYNFLINIPNETLNDLWNLLRLIFRLRKARIYFSILSIVPNTKLYNMVLQMENKFSSGTYLAKAIYWRQPSIYNIISKALNFFLILRRLVPKAVCDKLI